ncbi:hypothetical protein [Fodinibius sp. Rm-B-1B1-1]|uniref:hypothetical protein n=1 Tax=Fodinibius alkaliphilus TaxID=3140241 RepID=UPI00315B2FE5
MVTEAFGSMEVLGKGIVQYVSSNKIIISKGNKLFCKKRNNSHWKPWCNLPISLSEKFYSSNRWLSRLFRNEVHHVIKIRDGIFACFAFGKIYLVEENIGQVEVIGNIKGSRPLKICSDGSCIYYGVYTGNTERKPIKLFSYLLEESKWSVYHIFNNIRHIHGVFWDQYESNLWVTTGDLDHESIIWRFNDKGEPEKIATGSQQTRAVDLLFTKDAIFYTTDAPNEQNYIYCLDRKSGQVEQLQEIGGPVFYGKALENGLFFSTVVEPSEVNRMDAVELWYSNDEGKNWKKIKEFKKDFGHMKLFQYGQIKFPNGSGDGNNLWFTPYATEYDHQIMKLPLDSV